LCDIGDCAAAEAGPCRDIDCAWLCGGDVVCSDQFCRGRTRASIRVGGQLFVPGARAPRDAVNFSARPSVEQVAAKVLPSVVTLKTKAGDESELGSGIVLTSDGLIMPITMVGLAIRVRRRSLF
jgi:S1-C subfamily serine protease